MFTGLSPADFDAYLPAKWRSNVYNRERLEVKQRLAVLASQLAAGLAGPDGAPLVAAASVEHPALFNQKQVEAQHLYFSRGEAARRELDAIIDRARGVASLLEDPTPQRSHAFLSVSLFHDRVEVALRLHPEATVDRQNLLRKCQDSFELDRLVGLLRALPAGFVAGLSSALADATTLEREALEGLLARFGGSSTGELWTVSCARARAEALAAGPELVGWLGEALAALLPLYRFCAWARDNDFVSVREALAKAQTARRQRGISRGDEVRVVRGLFSGQLGAVQDVDARGALRVLIGKRTVKLDAADVEPRS